MADPTKSSSSPAKKEDGEPLRRRYRFHPSTVSSLQHWAEKKGVSENEYVEEAIMAMIRRENNDFDAPAVLIQQVNQLTAHLQALTQNVANLELVTTTGFDTMTTLARGDGYLVDERDGELDG